jgi:hypothetical protein
MAKTYLYKVFDRTGTTLLTTWPDVASDFSYEQEINSAGSQSIVTLARNPTSFGEGVDVKHLNRVEVSVIDAEQPNGSVIFKGFISSYTPNFAANSVEVVVLGYGVELANYMIEASTPTHPFYSMQRSYISPVPGDYGIGFGGIIPPAFPPFTAYAGDSQDLAQSFIAEGNNITKVRASIFPYNTGVAATTVECQIWSAAAGRPVARISTGTVTAAVSDSTGASALFDFSAAPVAVVPGQTYFIIFTAPAYTNILACYENQQSTYDGTGGDPRLRLLFGTVQDVSSWTYFFFNTDYTGAILEFDVWNDQVDTEVAYYSQDPGAILRSLIDKYQAAGGTLSYTSGTVELTGTVTSYTFNTNNILEGINKCLEMAPVGWYYYIDQATNLVHFHKKADAPEVLFTLGKDIISLAPEKRIENIVNVVYVTGGTVEGQVLFAKYIDRANVTANGRWQQNYIDGRITLKSTMDIIANTILGNHAAAEIRTSLEVADSNGGNGGYDIESALVGRVVGFRGFSGSGSPLWDSAVWDSDSWDYNLADIGSLALQITRLSYSPDKITISLSTVPPDVNKRIEDINRALQAQQTLYNPSQPD